MRQTAQEAWVNAVKSCGQSLIDNAEQIAGDYTFQTGTDIIIKLRPSDFVSVKVMQEYLPIDFHDRKKPASTNMRALYHSGVLR